MYLRKYGAATTVNFPLIKRDAVDFATTSDYTHATGDTKVKKDEGASANADAALVYEGEGVWSLSLTATEMQAARIVITVVDSATKAVEDQCVVIETYGNASAQHAFDLDTATQPVNVTQISGDSTAADNLEAAADGTGYNLGGGSVVAASVTGNVGGNVTGSVGSLATQAKADVNAEADTAISDAALATAAALTTAQNDLDILTGTDGATLAASQPNYAPSKAGDAMALTSGERTTLTAAIWAALTSGLSTVGSIGKLIVDNLNATVGSRLASTDYTAPPSAATIADAVWEEALADHEGTVGSAAEALAQAGGSGASAADIADAVLDEALSGHTTAGTLGKAIADVLEDTGTTLSASIAALNDLDSTAVQSAAEAALTEYDPPTRAEATSDKDAILTRLGPPAGDDIATDIAAVKTEVDKVPRTGATHRYTNTDTSATADVQISEVP